MFALNRYNMMPWTFDSLNKYHKASLIAMIEMTIKQEEKLKK